MARALRGWTLISVLALVGCRTMNARGAITFEPTPQALLADPSSDPSIVVRASSQVFALVLRGRDGGGGDLVMVRSDDAGDHFGDPLAIGAAPGEVRAHVGGTPRLLLGPRSELYAVWATPQALEVARSTDYGKSFGAPVPVPMRGARAPSFFDAAVAPDGTLLLAWLGRVPNKPTPKGTAGVSVASSRDGVHFDVAPGVASGACPCCRPALAADSQGRWFLSFRTVRAGIRDMVAMVTADRGGTWSAPVPVSRDGWRIDGCPHSGPALAVVNGALYVAWYSEAGGAPRLYWTRSPTARLAFAPRRRLSGALLDANQPALAVQGDQVFAAFQARDPHARGGWAPTGIYLRRLADGAAPPSRVPSGAGGAHGARLASMGAGRWAVVWTQQGQGATAELARARTRPTP